MAATTSNSSGGKWRKRVEEFVEEIREWRPAHRHPHRGREDFHRTSSDGDDPERRWERVPG